VKDASLADVVETVERDGSLAELIEPAYTVS